MTLLLGLTNMISIILVFVWALFLHRLDSRKMAASEKNIATCLDQLTELEKEAATGAIDAGAAATAREEIRRRILNADRAERLGSMRMSLSKRNLAVVAAAGVVIVGATALYTWGDVADSSAAIAEARAGRRAPEVERLAAAAAAWPPEPISQGQPDRSQGQTYKNLGSVDEMIAGLVQKLKQNPNNIEGWRMLGWSYFHTDRFEKSAEAYAKAIELSPSNGEFRSAYGEALMRSANGQVTDQAKATFERAVQLDPTNLRARFFIGLSKEQVGDKKAALDDWIAVLNDAGSSEPWLNDLTQRATRLAQDLGVDLSGRLYPKDAATSGGVLPLSDKKQATAFDAPPSKDGPTVDDVRRADAMRPDDRAAMIRGMVEGLAARLEESPNDVEGWIKLIRSRKVLGETEAAAQALHRAMEIFRDDPREHEKIAAVAREIGLSEE